MPSGRTQQEKGSHQQRYGPYTHIQPAPKKVKPQQERQRFKVQALSQLDAIANEGLQAVEAELTTMAWARNQQIWLRLDQPHGTGMHCEIVDNHGEPLQMSNQELYSVMVQINWTLKTQALANMQVQWRPKSAGKWHPFQWEAILHCPTAEGHRAVPSSVSRTGDKDKGGGVLVVGHAATGGWESRWSGMPAVCTRVKTLSRNCFFFQYYTSVG